MIPIDIPQAAYKTMVLEYVIVGNDGKRDRLKELEAEKNLKIACLIGGTPPITTM
jgi:hypothetical protein